MSCNQFQMKNYEAPQLELSSSSLLQRIKDGIVSPLALKLGFFTSFQHVPSPINHNSSILKLQKDFKAQEALDREQIAKLEQERQAIMQELSAVHLKIKRKKQDFVDVMMQIQELKCQISSEQNENTAIREEIIRIEREKQEQSLSDEDDQGEGDLLHYRFLSNHKSKINKNVQEDDMEEMDQIDLSQNPFSFAKRLGIHNSDKIYQMDSEEDPEIEMEEVD